MLKTLIDTETKTVTVKQEFLIDELLEVLKYHNVLDYKIILEIQIVKEFPPVNVPYSQPYYYGTGCPTITNPCVTTSDTAPFPLNGTISYTN